MITLNNFLTEKLQLNKQSKMADDSLNISNDIYKLMKTICDEGRYSKIHNNLNRYYSFLVRISDINELNDTIENENIEYLIMWNDSINDTFEMSIKMKEDKYSKVIGWDDLGKYFNEKELKILLSYLKNNILDK